MAPKPQGPTGSGDATPSSATSPAEKPSTPAAASSQTTSSILPKMSDPGPGPSYAHSSAAAAGAAAAASEPMTKTNSAGAGSSANTPSSKDANTSSTASPYGTRSRNRGGNTRPNYAEDRDVDMEYFELHPQRRDDERDPKKQQRQPTSAPVNGTADAHDAPPQPPPPRTTNGSSRKSLPSETKQSQAASKDQQSSNGTKPPAAAPSGPSQPPSKKRKATANQNSNASAADYAAAKKSSSHAPSGHAPMHHGAVERGYAATNLLTFENCGARPQNGKMIADDGTVLEVNDHVYLVCEPPGEPYYLARIMEFLHCNSDPTQPVDAIKVNWYYRPKDIARKVNDTRAVFATMHSDMSPLTSLRGKCTIKHKAEIPKLDEYRKNPDCFWFEKLYDRYIQKNYEVIPTFQIINVPEKVKKVLDERWKYILVEQGRGKELTSAVKLCKRCSGYCANNDSVDCAVCQNTYHMNCVRPPLLKKPSRGFAWSCAACSRAQERKLEARHTPNVGLNTPDEDEIFDEEEDDCVDTGRTSPAEGAADHPPATEEQIYQASLWPYRYLGIHAKVEDALDYDDRIYPRTATRVGPRHQAVVLDWPGRPIEYVKAAEVVEVKKSGKKDGRLSKEAQAALEAEKIAKANRPKWIQDEPLGYVPRGEDYANDDPRNTALLLWAPPELKHADKLVSHDTIDEYMEKANAMATSLGLPKNSTNLQDVALQVLFQDDFDTSKALKTLPKLDKDTFREPKLSPAEVKKFEEGIAKFGSELHSVKKHIKTVSPGDLVRFYYTWKKTERGKQIWDTYSGRKSKKELKKAEAQSNKVQDDVADDHDDSAFDADKATDKKRQFICKFCNTKQSRQWRRAPHASGALVTENGGKGANKDKGMQYIVALCRRCAELWRRYAIQWEDVEQLVSKVAQSGGRSWKKKVDEELLKEIVAAEQRSKFTAYNNVPDIPPANTVPPPNAPQPTPATQEPARKKLKTRPADKDIEMTGSESGSVSGSVPPQAAKKGMEKDEEPPAPPPVPEMPKARTMPCEVCNQVEPLGDQYLTCKECRLAVHRNCYGVYDNRNAGKWVCDMCTNDRSPHVSIHYKCVLCPVESTERDFVEPAKVTHKKRTEKDRERERLEREKALAAAEYYKKRQEDMNRPVEPREALKRTADNNWVHITCAVWTPEVKFGNAKALEPSEGIASIPRGRYSEVCKACKGKGGACISCHHCKAPVHVECAHQSSFLLGFEITPVKNSRRDQHNMVTINGESGAMSAAVWCKDHVPQKALVHRMYDVVDEAGTTALQLYVQNFKKADLALTGCARKANLISTAARMSSPLAVATPTAINRRISTTTLPAAASESVLNGDQPDNSRNPLLPGGKLCLTCGTDVSPRWYAMHDLVNGYHAPLGVEARKFAEQRKFQCHKCKKLNKQPKPLPGPSPPPEPSRPEAAVPAPPVMPLLAPTAPAAAPVLTNGVVHGTPDAVQPIHPEAANPTSRASPPANSPHMPGPDRRGPPPYGWPTPLQAPHQAAMVAPPGPMHPGGPAPPIQAPPLQAPPIAPPPMPLGMPGRVPAPLQAPGPVPPAQSYQAPPPPPPPASTPYGDWHRTTSHHASPLQQPMNGVPGRPSHISPVQSSAIPPLMPPTLRPPPMTMSHGSNLHAPLTNGHMAQPHPMVNGAPPPPRRMSGPPPPPPPTANGGPYMPGYHAPHHSPPVYHRPVPPANGAGGMVQPRIDHAFAQVLNPQRSTSSYGPAPPAHMSPPPALPPPLAARHEPPRPTSGASASPSLRNLLS